VDKLEEMIRRRDVVGVLDRLFSVDHGTGPKVRPGFRRETELWDFKRGLPSLRVEHEVVWADIVADVAAFHNQKGGIILFGIDDATLSFVGTRDAVDAKRFNERVRRYLGDTVWVEFSREFIQADQRFLGVAVIPPRDLVPLRMRCDAPVQSDGSRAFNRGDLCVRDGDSTRVFRGAAADEFLAKNRLPSSDAKFFVNDSRARILRPDWTHFVLRDELCQKVLGALRDERTYVTTLNGIGGIGKTALATWAVIDAYRTSQFEFIVSVSAKDRELTPRGLRPVEATLSTYDDLINEILAVLGFSEMSGESLAIREEAIGNLIVGSNLLLFIDNLETVEDRRVIDFLEKLPKPVKAITTSRTTAVRTAAFPISVGPLSDLEATKFFDHYATALGRAGLRNASEPEKLRIVKACSAVPLAVQWLIGHSKDIDSALRLADALNRSGARDDELLEFCFRRVHVGLSPSSRSVLAALTLTDKPQPIEAIAVASELSLDRVDEALDELQSCSLVERVWDDRMCDLSMRCLPITRRFAYRELARNVGEEQWMRARLTDWYDGKDIEDDVRRQLVVAARQGRKEPDVVLVDAAIAYRRQGHAEDAEKYFKQAIDRNPRSWRAHCEYGELLRDVGRIGDALEEYGRAAAFAPARGNDRARVFREWGMLLRTAGTPDCAKQAIEKFEIAREQTPNDPKLLHALASCLVRQGAYRKAQLILERLVTSNSAETRARSYDLLLQCYQKLNEPLKLALLREAKEKDDDAKRASAKSRRNVLSSSRPLSAGITVKGRPQRRG
jgi:tetratricopeptide (TPR) repeat protein